MKPVDDRIREHYGSKQLDPERAKLLLARAHADAELQAGAGAKKVATRVGIRRLAVAAGVLLVIALGFKGFLPRIQAQRMTQSAAQEIAANHSRGLKSEVFAQDYGELRGQLERLEFSLAPVPQSIREQYSLVGGRYCSILKIPAAQLALQDPESGELVSLYVAPLDPALEALNEGTTEIDGIRVQIIKHAGRVFALVGSATEKAPRT